MWQAILAAKDDLPAKVPKPSRKKRKTLPKPNPTSEYSLRKNPKKNLQLNLHFFLSLFIFGLVFSKFFSDVFNNVYVSCTHISQ